MNSKDAEKKYREKIKSISTPTLKAILLTPTTDEEHLRLMELVMAGKTETEIMEAIEKMKRSHMN